MKLSPFIGRTAELAVLDRLQASDKAEFLILYGRRRIGKTRLLTHWMETSHPKVFFWVAEPTSSFDQLRSFSQAMLRFSRLLNSLPRICLMGIGAPPLNNWHVAENERVAVIMDEFTYLLEAEPAVSAYLQHAWDHTLCKSNLLADPFRLPSGNDAASGSFLPGSPVRKSHSEYSFTASPIWRHPFVLSALQRR